MKKTAIQKWKSEFDSISKELQSIDKEDISFSDIPSYQKTVGLLSGIQKKCDDLLTKETNTKNIMFIIKKIAVWILAYAIAIGVGVLFRSLMKKANYDTVCIVVLCITGIVGIIAGIYWGYNTFYSLGGVVGGLVLGIIAGVLAEILIVWLITSFAGAVIITVILCIVASFKAYHITDDIKFFIKYHR